MRLSTTTRQLPNMSLEERLTKIRDNPKLQGQQQVLEAPFCSIIVCSTNSLDACPACRHRRHAPPAKVGIHTHGILCRTTLAARPTDHRRGHREQGDCDSNHLSSRPCHTSCAFPTASLQIYRDLDKPCARPHPPRCRCATHTLFDRMSGVAPGGAGCAGLGVAAVAD
jgi:hypothetical protein